MDRRAFLATSVSAVAGFLAESASSRARAAPRHPPVAGLPNIVLFLVDDLGWQDVSEPFDVRRSAFNDRYRTPNVQRLAREGVKFTQAYACPVCSPSRVSLLTGMNAARHRVTNWTLRKNTTTDEAHPFLQFPEWNVNGMSPVAGVERTVHATPLPALLKSAGYATIHCGKAHFGAIDTPAADPLNLGFDVNVAGHAAGAPGSHLGLHDFSADWRKGGRVWDVPGLDEYHGHDVFLTQALTERATKALDAPVAAHRPFFLYMSHYAVHTPIEEDARFIRKYVDAGLDPIEARYASMVEGVDRSLGDILAFLDNRAVAANTLVLFMSDNGGLSAEGRGGEPNTHNKPLSSGKGSAREGGIREPMIVRWPGNARRGAVEPTPVIIEDFFPTLLDVAGVRAPSVVQHVDGVSFLPLLGKPGGVPPTSGSGQTPARPAADRPLFWHYPNNWGPKGPGIGAFSAIRRGDWKLIYYHADRSFELFNLRDDIGETTNLAVSQPGRVKTLAASLGEYLRGVAAQMPTDTRTGRVVDWPDRV
jgi:arylsulfatase A-like enzyme